MVSMLTILLLVTLTEQYSCLSHFPAANVSYPFACVSVALCYVNNLQAVFLQRELQELHTPPVLIVVHARLCT